MKLPVALHSDETGAGGQCSLTGGFGTDFSWILKPSNPT
jgi:hypothetical protein